MQPQPPDDPKAILHEALRRWLLQRRVRVMLVSNTDVLTIATAKFASAVLEPAEDAPMPEPSFSRLVYILGPQEIRVSAWTAASDPSTNLRETLIFEVMKRLDELAPQVPAGEESVLALDEECSVSRDGDKVFFMFTAGGPFPADALPALPKLIGARLIQHCHVIQHELRRGTPPFTPAWVRIRSQIEGTNSLLEMALGTPDHRIDMPEVLTVESTPPFLSGLIGACGALLAVMQKPAADT